MKVLVLSALARDTGSWLRARSIARSLEAHAEVEFVRAPTRSLPFLFELVLSAPRYFLAALTTDADCLLAVKPFPNVTVPLLVSRLFRKRRIVVDVDDRDDAYFPGWRGRLVGWLQKPGPRRFDLITFHNENLGELLLGHFRVRPERLLRLPQGVDLQTFRPRPEVPVVPKSLLFVGHLNIASELPWILETVRDLQRSRSVTLTVAGGGPCLEEFRDQARELGVAARFTGALSTEGVALEIAAAEACLVYYAPSEANRHRSSMKLRECLAMGKKVVCNDFDELADFGPAAYLCSSEREDYLRTIEQVLDGGDGREASAVEWIRERYDWAALGPVLFERLERDSTE